MEVAGTGVVSALLSRGAEGAMRCRPVAECGWGLGWDGRLQ